MLLSLSDNVTLFCRSDFLERKKLFQFSAHVSMAKDPVAPGIIQFLVLIKQRFQNSYPAKEKYILVIQAAVGKPFCQPSLRS